MAETQEAMDEVEGEAAEASRSLARKLGKWTLWFVAAIVLLLGAGIALLNTQFGERLIAERLQRMEFANGLNIAIGRIEGDIYAEAVLHDVRLSDPQGVFLTIPRAEIDWNPLAWASNTLSIDSLAVRRGKFERLPELIPSEEDGPLLPGFDIRIGRLEIDNLTLAPGIAGTEAERVDLIASADIDDGQLVIDAEGTIGADDRIALAVDARPDEDLFDLSLDYREDEGGILANMLGAQADYRVRAAGEGKWSAWNGALLVDRADERVGAFKLTNRGGRFGIVGTANAQPMSSGMVAAALGSNVRAAIFADIDDRIFDTDFAILGAGLETRGQGVVDLGANEARDFTLLAEVTDPAMFGEGIEITGGRAMASLSGPLSRLSIEHTLLVERLAFGDTALETLVQRGTISVNDSGIEIPLDAQVARVSTGNALVDPKLVEGRLDGRLVIDGNRLFSNELNLRFPDSSAILALRGDLARGRYALAGPVRTNGLELDGVGRVGGNARIALTLPETGGWSLRSELDAAVQPVTNDTLASLAGPRIAITGGIGIGSAAPLTFRNLQLSAEKLTANLNGRVYEGTTEVAGTGRHTQYGPFTIEASLTDAGPEAVLVLANPLPAAGLADVRVAIAPTEEGLAIETQGGSLLGAFDGDLVYETSEGGSSRLRFDRFDLSGSSITGALTLAEGGLDGSLDVGGSGLDGTVAFAPVAGAQSFDIDLEARRARFGGDTPISIARADIDIDGRFGQGPTQFEGGVFAEGVTYGSIFLGRLAAGGEIVDGRGDITASLSGRRGSRFNLQFNAGIAPERIALAMRGEFAGSRISMPRRAVLTKTADAGWRISRSQITYGDGNALIEGRIGGDAGTSIDLALDDMPLSLTDIAVRDLGLGGRISGKIGYDAGASGLPTADFRVKIDDLTRSGLVLTSTPLDIALVGRLRTDRLTAKAVMSDEEGGEGRLQMAILGLPQSGDVVSRLRAGSLRAELRYQGQAEALWRLAAVDAFDLTGPVSAVANARGTLANPIVRGRVESDKLRVRSAISGTDIRNIKVDGRFRGSLLRLTRFAGETKDAGTVIGSGTVDLEGLGERVDGRRIEIRGPKLDLRANATNARLVNANGLSATISGPLRIVSNGLGGTIAGRVRINRASWRLGTSADIAELPQIDVREINRRADVEQAVAPGRPWRYLIDARGRSRIDVDGLGLDSEWGADIILRGTTDDPRIGGRATVVRGAYSFAGTRFELTRGEIDFDENVPIDPRLDIEAETDRDGLQVTVNVRGNAQQPEISFSSIPALPEEEILARLLFGGSITELSATDALQLGAAVASLRGGGGMDPINQLRTAIGLDRLRIVGADPALDRGTGVALGKNIGRRFYVEIITDGRGYSATELEFRITSWLSLLAAVSTIGRESMVAEISRDY